MGHSFVIGETVVGAEEMSEKLALGTIGRFREEAKKTKRAEIQFSTGTVRASELVKADKSTRAAVPDYTPVGIGRPMSIEILSVYAGDVPQKSFFGGNPDMLVTSAVKGVQTFEAAPRAINQIKQKVEDNQYFQPSALDEGSPVVYFTPALVNATTLCSFELIADTFGEKIFEGISKLFSVAAGIPIFAPANAYLMAGSFLTKIFSGLGKALLESPPLLKSEIPLRFNTPEIPEALARMIILYNDRDGRELAGYKAGVVESGPGRHQAALVHKETGKEYRGDSPYIIISLDGRPRPELEGFAPKLASAAMLERFYGAQDTGGQLVEALTSAMELYNDYTCRQKAEKLKEQMKKLDPNSNEYKTAEGLFKAYIGNIQQDFFKIEME